MPVNIGSINLKAAYVGSTPLKAIYVGSQQVWTSKPTEVLPNNTSLYGARDNFRALLAKYGLDYKTVRELPFNLDTSQVTNMSYMFDGCSSLVSVPDLNTGQVTNTSYMFYNCSSLKDGNVRLIRSDGTKPSSRTGMISGSGLTREPFFLPNGTPIN